jgi:nucleotide-binding universal stress UspA family protein
MKTLLVAVDSSGVSDAVVAEAQNLARNANGRIMLLTVVQPPVITSEYAPMIDNYEAITEAGEKAAQKRLLQLKAVLESGGIATETVQLTGSPVAQILQQAETHAADYIVMGSHGHTALYDLLVGSTTHGVLLRSKCPVVIVPSKDRHARRADR